MLRDKILAYRLKTIRLEEIADLCSKTEVLSVCINDLCAEGVLEPVKSSGTNGSIAMPLYHKYRIKPPIEDMAEYVEQIRRLHPKLIANEYLLKKPAEYKKKQDFIQKLNKYLISEHTECLMSRREKSLVIFGDEKVLDNNISFLTAIGLTGKDLFFYATPEYCFADYIPERRDNMTLIICENKDIWFNIRRLMFENKCSRIFDIPFDGVIFGDGNDITGRGKFSTYADFLCGGKARFLYCGDIDRAGFDIFLRLKKEADDTDIALFVPMYEKMLELCNIERLPASDDNRGIELDMQEILSLFEPKQQSEIKEIIAQNKRLPQEIINYSVLSRVMG